MNAPFSFDRDRQVITGFAPTKIWVNGPTLGPGLRGRVEGLLAQFHMQVYAGGLQQLRKVYRLEDGTVIEVKHTFGTTQVIVTPVPPEKPTSEFFGGILIRPRYHAVQESFLGYRATSNPYDAANEPGLRTVMPEIAEPTRPSVPGTASDDVTDWLVVQISKTKKLGPKSIASKAARILRIKDPKFGDVVEVATEIDRYLLSTQPAGTAVSAPSTVFQEFYLCGRRVINIPPLTYTLGEFSGPSYTRLRTIGLKFSGFEKAHLAEGIVVLAVGGRLYAVDTLARPVDGLATWQLLAAETAPSNMNAYGLNFTEAVVGNVFTLTCSGTNGAGACSGFTVVVTTTESGRTIAGSVNIALQTWVAAVAASSAFSHIYHADWVVNVSLTTVPAIDLGGGTIVMGTAENITSTGITTGTITYSASSGRAAILPDPFAGGTLPYAKEQTGSITWEGSRQIAGIGLDLSSVPGVIPEQYASVVQRSIASSCVMAMGGIADVASSVSASYSTTTTGSPVRGNVTSTSIDASLVTYEGDVPNNPVTADDYLAFDQHTQSIALKRRQSRRVTFSPSTTIDLRHVFDFIPAATQRLVPVVAEGTKASARVITTAGAALHEWADLWTFFPTPPPAAIPSSGSIAVMGGLPIALPFGKEELFPAYSGGHPRTVTYEGIGAMTPLVEINVYTAPGFGTQVPTDRYLGSSSTSGGTTTYTHLADHTVSNPGGMPTTPMTASAYASLYPTSAYAVPPGSTTVASGNIADFVAIQPSIPLLFGTTPYVNASSTASLRDLVLRDLRTGGYIAQLHQQYNSATPGFNFLFVDTVVGNAKGTIALKDLIDEWVSLGERTTPADRKLFLDFVPEYKVALI